MRTTPLQSENRVEKGSRHIKKASSGVLSLISKNLLIRGYVIKATIDDLSVSDIHINLYKISNRLGF